MQGQKRQEITTNQQFVNIAWAVYEQGLGVKELAQKTANDYNGAKDKSHAARGRLSHLRHAGYSVPDFNVKGLKRTISFRDKAIALIKQVAQYLESIGGPIYDLWNDDLIFSQRFCDNHPDGAAHKPEVIFDIDADMTPDLKASFQATLDDIDNGIAVGYQSLTQADDRRSHRAIDVYVRVLDAIKSIREDNSVTK